MNTPDRPGVIARLIARSGVLGPHRRGGGGLLARLVSAVSAPRHRHHRSRRVCDQCIGSWSTARCRARVALGWVTNQLSVGGDDGLGFLACDLRRDVAFASNGNSIGMVRLPPDTTFLCGAGVSAESGLPDGQTLATRAFGEVAAGTRVYSVAALQRVHDALQWTATGEPALRLELMLEVMSREIPVEVLAGVYSVVLGASPTLAHYILALSRRPIVTTNQDELVEAAANDLGLGASVLHLHGMASDPASIVTTLGQYSEGLSTGISTKLQGAVGASHLVVVGYSGRDLDVMPLVRNAKRVTWLHFAPKHGGSPPAAEVRALAADLGARMRVVPIADPKGWIFDRLPAADRRVASNRVLALRAGPVASMSPETQAAFKSLSLLDKRLALARVLMQVNDGAAALAGLRMTNRSHPGDARVHMRSAEALGMIGHRSQALRSYRRAAQLADGPQQRASSLLGSGTVLSSGARYPEALADLHAAEQAAGAIPEPRNRRNLQGKVAAAQGRIRATTGDDAQALKDYGRALSAARQNHNLDLKTSALIFGSDVYRSQGDLRRALAHLDLAFEDNELYARPFTRGWGSFYRGLTRCASGQFAGGFADLYRCRDVAEETGNDSMLAWALLTLSSYSLISALPKAMRYADECRAAIQANGGAWACEIRLDWNYAELARATGDYDEVGMRIAALRVKLGRADAGSALPYMEPHMCASMAEVARERGDPDAVDRLRWAKHLFLAGHWRHAATRMEVAVWLASTRRRTPSQLIALCVRNGYDLELHRLQSGNGRHYPLHIT